jgi:hypothetical protein
MKYIVVVKELGKEYSRSQKKEVDTFKTVYEQSFADISVSELAMFLNTQPKKPQVSLESLGRSLIPVIDEEDLIQGD